MKYKSLTIEQIRAGVLVMPEAEYRSAKGYVTSHALRMFAQNPYRYKLWTQGLVTDPDADFFAFGRAGHVLIIEGADEFAKRYTINDGPINEKTGKPYGKDTNKHQDWLAEQVKPIISTPEWDTLRLLAASIEQHAEARKLIACDGVAEAVVRTEIGGEPVQSRLDYFTPDALPDLKTTANLDTFEDSITRYGYVHQMAFYRFVVFAKFGVSVPPHLVAVEKVEPYRVGVWKFNEDVLTLATSQILAAVTALQGCRERGEWPTFYENVRTFRDVSKVAYRIA